MSAPVSRRALLAGTAGAFLLAGCSAQNARPSRRMSAAPAITVPPGGTVAFYGDSLTSGFRASSPSRRWSTLLCARRGWTEFNPSIPGLGFVQDRRDRDLPGLIIDAAPSLVIVTLGANDLRIVDAQPLQLTEAIDADLARLRAGTAASILVAMPFSSLSARPPQLTSLEAKLRAGAESIHAPVIESGDWMVGHRDLTVDTIHFSDAGEAFIEGKMDAALTKLMG